MVDYCTVADVTQGLQIASEDAAYHKELEDCIVSACALVDSLLIKESLTVPAVVPQNVKDAAACFAAWGFRERRDPAGSDGIPIMLDVFGRGSGETPTLRDPLIVCSTGKLGIKIICQWSIY